MAVAVVFDGGGGGEVSALGEGRMTVLADRAFAPGAPVSMVATLPDGELRVAARTVGSKRGEDGRFAVMLRFVNLTRDGRERLSRAFAP